MRTLLVPATVLLLIAGAAFAQMPAEQIKGKWIAANSVVCGQMNMEIASVDPDGTVHGRLECMVRRVTVVLGNKKERDQSMVARIAGNGLTIEGTGSEMGFVFKDDKLVGWATSGSGARRDVTFTRQP